MEKPDCGAKRDYLRDVCLMCVPVVERFLCYPKEPYIRKITYRALKALCEEYCVVISVIVLSSKHGHRCFVYSQRSDGESACAWSQVHISDGDMMEICSYFQVMNNKLSKLFGKRFCKL